MRILNISNLRSFILPKLSVFASNLVPYKSMSSAVFISCAYNSKDTKTSEFVYSESVKSKFGEDSLKKLSSLLQESKFSPELKTTRVFFQSKDCFDGHVPLIVGLGCSDNFKYCPKDLIDQTSESVRIATGKAVATALEYKFDSVLLDDCNGLALPVGEAVGLALYKTDFYKNKKPDADNFQLTPANFKTLVDSQKDNFEKGLILAKCQNFARKLAETPANLMTPTIAAETITSEVKLLDNPELTVVTRDKAWIEEQKMGLFLSVAQGSDQPPKFVEMHYKSKAAPADQPPIVFVGKGITFDTGGISIKPSPQMGAMKADMEGGACTAAAVLAAAQLQLPIHLIGLVPFTENMPSGRATKPGDVHTGMNGKTVEIDNTDAEGRLVLADTLVYAEKTFKPRQIVDMATLTGAIIIAIGSAASALYTHNEKMCKDFYDAAAESGDRVWRMPLFSEYTAKLKSRVADLNNITNCREAGSCTAAAFLKEFLENSDNWVHLDIAGTMENSGNDKWGTYICPGMTGRPTRTLINYLMKQ